MTLKNLQEFREAAYKLLGTGEDAVMDLMDAVLVTRSVHSFAELSMSPVFRRKWPSLYEALRTLLSSASWIDEIVHQGAAKKRTYNRLVAK